jgi:RimJ/RimL family protein N-acetyltransferase
VDVRLREVREDDLPILFEHQRDPVAVAMAGVPSRDRQAFLEHWRRILSDDSLMARTVLVDGQVAGNVVAFPDDDGRRLIGYWLGREHWGKGVGTAAVGAFLRLETTRPLYARVVAENRGSIRILERCGFREVERGRTPSGLEELVLALDEPTTTPPGPGR